MKIKQEKAFNERIVASQLCPTMGLLAVATPSYMTIMRTKTMASLLTIHAAATSPAWTSSLSSQSPSSTSPAAENIFDFYFSPSSASSSGARNHNGPLSLSDLLASSTAIPANDARAGALSSPTSSPSSASSSSSAAEVSIAGIQWSPCGRMIAMLFSTSSATKQTTGSNNPNPNASIISVPFVTAAQIIHVESAQIVREIIGFNPNFINTIRTDAARSKVVQKAYYSTQVLGGDDDYEHFVEGQIQLILERLISDINHASTVPTTVIPDLFSRGIHNKNLCRGNQAKRNGEEVKNDDDRLNDMEENKSAFTSSSHSSSSSRSSSFIRALGFGWAVLPTCNAFVSSGETECTPLRPCYEAAAQHFPFASSSAGGGGAGTNTTVTTTAQAGASSSSSSDAANASSLLDVAVGYQATVTKTVEEGKDANNNTVASESKIFDLPHPQSLLFNSSSGVSYSPSPQTRINAQKPLTTLLTIEALKKTWADGLCSIFMLWGQSGKMSLFVGGCFEMEMKEKKMNMYVDFFNNNNNAGGVHDHNTLSSSPSSSSSSYSSSSPPTLWTLQMDPITFRIAATASSSSSSSPSPSSSNIIFVDIFTTSTQHATDLRSSHHHHHHPLSPASIEDAILKCIALQLARIAYTSLCAGLGASGNVCGSSSGGSGGSNNPQTSGIGGGWDKARVGALEAMRILDFNTNFNATTTTAMAIKCSQTEERTPTILAEYHQTMPSIMTIMTISGNKSTMATTTMTSVPLVYRYNQRVLALLQDLTVAFAARPYYDDVCDYMGVGTSLIVDSNKSSKDKLSTVNKNIASAPVDAAEIQRAAARLDKAHGDFMLLLNHLVIPSLSWAACFAERVGGGGDRMRRDDGDRERGGERQDGDDGISDALSTDDDFQDEEEEKEEPLASTLSRSIEFCEALLQQTANERDELMLLLQFVLQQKLKITLQQRSAISGMIPPPPPSAPAADGGTSSLPPYPSTYLTPAELLLTQMIPSLGGGSGNSTGNNQQQQPLFINNGDTLVPVAAALLPHDFVTVSAILADMMMALSQDEGDQHKNKNISRMFDEDDEMIFGGGSGGSGCGGGGAFAPHIVTVDLRTQWGMGRRCCKENQRRSNSIAVDSKHHCQQQQQQEDGGVLIAVEPPPLWFSSCLSLPSHSLVADRASSRSHSNRHRNSNSVVSSPPSPSVNSSPSPCAQAVIIDLPPMLQYTMVNNRRANQRRGGGGGAGGGLITSSSQHANSNNGGHHHTPSSSSFSTVAYNQACWRLMKEELDEMSARCAAAMDNNGDDENDNDGGEEKDDDVSLPPYYSPHSIGRVGIARIITNKNDDNNNDDANNDGNTATTITIALEVPSTEEATKAKMESVIVTSRSVRGVDVSDPPILGDNENNRDDGIIIAKIVASQTHFAILVVSKSPSSWLHKFHQQRREEAAQIEREQREEAAANQGSSGNKKKLPNKYKISALPQTTQQSSPSPPLPFAAAILLIDRSSCELDEGLTNDTEKCILLPLDSLPSLLLSNNNSNADNTTTNASASSSFDSIGISFNTDKGLLSVNDGNRMVLFDLFDDDEDEDEEANGDGETDNAN